MRPVEHGPRVLYKDCQDLLRIIKRVETDPTRSEKHRRKLVRHLKSAHDLLIDGRTLLTASRRPRSVA